MLGEGDPLLLIQYAGNYYNFLKMIDKEYSGEMTDREEACLEFVSQNPANERYSRTYNPRKGSVI